MAENKDNSAAWWSSLIGLVIALIMGSLALYSAWKSGKEVAKLRHEHDVEMAKRERALVFAQIAVEQADRDRATAQATEHESNVWDLRAQIAANEAEHSVAISKIENLTSWQSFRVKRVNETASSLPTDSVSSSNE